MLLIPEMALSRIKRIITVCNDEKLVWTNRDDAKEYFLEKMIMSDDEEHILSMSKRMRGLVESLLELARMDKGVLKNVSEKIDFSKLVLSCTLPFEPLFYEKGMKIEINTEKEIWVYGDKTKLKQVLDILLDNALKYSESNVFINLKTQGSHALLSVSGDGRPLSKSQCRDIFKRFYRADESRNDGNSYGLGLSIAVKHC